jgi:Variant SH3 domain
VIGHSNDGLPPTGEDELDLRVGQIVWVLSKDESISGDYGWWTGKIGDRVGIFPANYVTNDDLMLRSAQPDEINYDDLDVKEVIGAGELIRFCEFGQITHPNFSYQAASAKSKEHS